MCRRSHEQQQSATALTLLNDPVFVEASRAFAARVIGVIGTPGRERVEYAMELALCRVPTDEEVQALTEMYQTQLKYYQENPDAVSYTHLTLPTKA